MPSGRVPRGIRCATWCIRPGTRVGRRAWQEGSRPRIEGSRIEARVFLPRHEPFATYVIAPGLHFDGPDDPRLDRFCRVLAYAGFRVVAPIIPAHAELLLHPSAASDFERVVVATAERFDDRRLALFAISFGSWLALEAAARKPELVDGVISFGGFADIESAIRFAVDGVMRGPNGDVTLARDPLNQPALFLNLLPHLSLSGETTPLADAWRELAFRSWGKMELKGPGRFEPIVRELLPRVPTELRDTYLIGAGVVPGGDRLAAFALERARASLSYVDPLTLASRVKCPFVICHGRDDDVIPWNEAEKLEKMLRDRVPVRLLVTGLYGHTGVELPSARAIGREVRTLFQMAEAIAHAGELRQLWS
jgi:pimeloyl-ACP methyl ester carboxylesterase